MPLPLLVAKAVNYAAANLEMKIVPEIQYTFLTCRVGFIGLNTQKPKCLPLKNVILLL